MFFDQNKTLIEITAIFYAILGVFLNIQNLNENLYLQNIQSVLLLAASICSVILIFKGSFFIIYLEKKLDQKLDMDFSGSLYAIFIGLQAFILFNLWSFISHSYQNALMNMLKSMEIYIIIFIFYLTFGIGKKIFILLDSNRISGLVFSLLYALTVLLGSSIIYFLNIYTSGSVPDNILYSLINTSLLLTAVLSISFMLARKQKSISRSINL